MLVRVRVRAQVRQSQSPDEQPAENRHEKQSSFCKKIEKDEWN